MFIQMTSPKNTPFYHSSTFSSIPCIYFIYLNTFYPLYSPQHKHSKPTFINSMHFTCVKDCGHGSDVNDWLQNRRQPFHEYAIAEPGRTKSRFYQYGSGQLAQRNTTAASEQFKWAPLLHKLVKENHPLIWLFKFEAMPEELCRVFFFF